METRTPSPDTGLVARNAALDLMASVMIEGRILSDVAQRVLSGLEPADAARANRLANAVFRNFQRSDRVLGRFVRQMPPDDVMNALRLATYELLAVGEAPHGVVSSAVTLVRKRSGEDGLARMTNAVLRRVSECGLIWDDLPIPEMPKTIRKPLVAAYGGVRVRAIESVHASAPPLDITPKSPGMGDLPDALHLPTGSLRVETPGQVSAMPGYGAGDWWVQDAAAALPVQLFGDLSGRRVLDLCAAPGGKTMQLAAGGADVTALDISEKRLATVQENLTRTGLAASIVAADALDWKPEAEFDAVLLDAPCSATGTLRRNPDLPFAKADLDLDPLLSVQSKLLDRAVNLVRPGGLVIYCTCSLFPSEGEEQVSAALTRQPDLALVPIKPEEAAGIAGEWCADGALRITPESWADRGGIDGFYIARLKRVG